MRSRRRHLRARTRTAPMACSSLPAMRASLASLVAAMLVAACSASNPTPESTAATKPAESGTPDPATPSPTAAADDGAATPTTDAPPIAADAKAEIGKPAPDFTLVDLDGKTHKLSEHAGKIVVLEWFNPQCPFVNYAHGDGPL